MSDEKNPVVTGEQETEEQAVLQADPVAHLPHSMHFSWLMRALPSRTSIAPVGQACSQRCAMHPRQAEPTW